MLVYICTVYYACTHVHCRIMYTRVSHTHTYTHEYNVVYSILYINMQIYYCTCVAMYECGQLLHRQHMQPVCALTYYTFLCMQSFIYV